MYKLKAIGMHDKLLKLLQSFTMNIKRLYWIAEITIKDWLKQAHRITHNCQELHMIQQRGISPTIPKYLIYDLWDIRAWQNKEKNYHYHSLLFLLPLLRKSDLPSATIGFLSVLSANANLQIILKAFTLTYSSIDKSKYKVDLTYMGLFEGFQNGLNVIQMSLYN